ncbi:MAG: guanitoxin biosynthesis pre-guanitoxin forming N-methyltransferase GntF [Anaerolineae bacterium]
MNITRDYSIFNPTAYLQEYYTSFPSENLAVLRFLIQAFRTLPAHSLTLEFGSGPTLYSAIVAAGQVEEIHLSDYLAANRTEVQKWLHQHPEAFNWDETIRTVLALEGKEAAHAQVRTRAAEIRRRVKQVLPCDATCPAPLEGASQYYDVLVTNLCLEAVATDKKHWRQCFRNVTSVLKPGGQLILTAVKGGNAYSVGQSVFAVVHLLEDDVTEALLEAGFAPESISIKGIEANHPVYPYKGLMFVLAAKSAQGHPKF